MKWVTLICVLLCTIATESRHLQKRDAEHHSRRIGDIFVEIGRTNFRHIVLVMSSQNFQKCPLAEHMKGVDELTAFAERCVEDEDIEDCKKPMNTIFYDTACKDPQLGEVYPWGPECCGKTEPEREKCFHDHEDKNVEPFKRPDADAACKLQKDDPHEAYHYYAHTVARRHPTLLPPAVLELAEQYSMIMNECCAAEEREKCFDGKFVEVQKTTFYLENKQKQSCHILEKFPERVTHAKSLAKIAQKYPSISLDVAHKLIVQWVHLSKDCCKDDVVECMVEKLEYIQHVCDNQEKISPNLKTCCEKPKLKRAPCIWDLPKDDIPADLPKEMKEFVEDEHVCEHFAAEKDGFLEKFLYEFSRRHPELPNSGLLRAGGGYEELLTKCCAMENPVECHKAAPQIFEARIKENMALTKQNCEAYEKAEPHIFQTILLGRYVPKMPQVSDETLLKITGKMTQFAGKCCALPEGQIMACAEDKLDFLLGEMCERESHTFINDQVHHCCVDSLSRRRPCFTKLGVDPTYKAPEFDENLFKVNADVCEGTKEEQKNKRLPLLIHVLKLKPDMSAEKTKEIVGEFIKVREECCAAEDRQDCFDKKRPDFLIHLKDIFTH